MNKISSDIKVTGQMVYFTMGKLGAMEVDKHDLFHTVPLAWPVHGSWCIRLTETETDVLRAAVKREMSKPHIVIRQTGAGYVVEVYRSRAAACFVLRTGEFVTMREAVGLALNLLTPGHNTAARLSPG